MKKSYYLLGFLPLFYSCSEIEDLPNVESSVSNVTTRTAGDGKYDVLGYGYDVTEEYMGEHSVRLKVLDVNAFIKENEGRFDNPFLGVIDQRVYAGEDVYSFMQDLITESNFDGSVASVGKEAKDSSYFSGSIKNGFKSSTLYSYSSKYSFAQAEVLKKQRQYYLNTDVETLSRYLSSVFLEDLNKYSADKIIEMYGTHVLTNITVGGKYTASYKSVILEETNRTEKKETVSAGAKYNLSVIGLDANGTWTSTEITNRNRKNSSWECHIKSIGGSTSGTSMTVTSGQSVSYTVNLGAWTESVDDSHSKLVDVDWKATYPIYDLISNPIRKEELKRAVEKYIASKQIKMIALTPLYQFGKNRSFHYNTNLYSLGWERHGIVCYVSYDKNEDYVSPLYQFQKKGDYHYNTRSYSLGWINEGITCYIYKSKVYDELVPLYQFFDQTSKYRYHYSTQVYSLGWINQGVVGYVFL